MTTNPATGFDAGAEELTFDFTKYVEGAKGVIPEPSSEQIERLIEFLRQVMPTKKDEDGKDTLDLDKLSETFEGKEATEIEVLMNTSVSEVCSGTPSVEQIAALPFRVKKRFYGWLLGSLLSPEA